MSSGNRMDGGTWSAASRNQYNLRDAVFRCTTQVWRTIIIPTLVLLKFEHYLMPDFLRNSFVLFISSVILICILLNCYFIEQVWFLLNAGVSEFMDCYLFGSGQCRYVELEIRILGTPILRTTVLPTSVHTIDIPKGRVSDSQERSNLWKSSRQTHKADSIIN